jgi:hypothetical protein
MMAMGEPEISSEREEKSRLPVAFAAGVGVVLILAAGLVLLTRITQSHGRGTAADKLPFGSAEQSYAPQIHFEGGQMSQATNLLNQEFTYVAGTITNNGPRNLGGVDVVFEFHDPFNQVILRDTQRLIDPKAEPLAVGHSRDFQITLGEHIPSDWNQQYPSIRVAGLILE